MNTSITVKAACRQLAYTILLLLPLLVGAGPAQAQLSCSSSPFGSRLPLVSDKELFTVYSSTNTIIMDEFDEMENNNVWEVSGRPKQSVVFRNQSEDDYAITTGDLLGDRMEEGIVAYASSGSIHVAAKAPSQGNDLFTDTWTTGTQATNIGIAAGNMFGYGDRDIINVAWLDAVTGRLLLMATGAYADDILMNNGTSWGFHLTDTVAGITGINTINRRNLSIATGDLDGDGYDDEVVVAFLIPNGKVRLAVFQFCPDCPGFNSANWNYTDLALTDINVGNFVTHVTVAVGDIDGIREWSPEPKQKNYRDEIVLLTDKAGDSSPTSNSHQIRAFKAKIDKDQEIGNTGDCLPNSSVYNGICLTASNTWSQNQNARSIDLALGDTDADGIKEIVVGTGFNGNVKIAVYDAERIFSLPSTLILRNQFTDTFNEQARDISLALADIDHVGRDTILAAYRREGSSTTIRTLQLLDDVGLDDNGETKAPELIEQKAGDDPNGSSQQNVNFPNSATNTKPLLAFADMDSDSLEATYEGVNGEPSCQQVIEPSIMEVVYTPPNWMQLNSGILGSVGASGNIDGAVSAYIGQSKTSGGSQSESMERSAGHSTSGFVDATAGLDIGVAELSATFSYSSSREYTRSSSATLITEESLTFNVNKDGAADFVVFQDAVYNCYNYQVRAGNTPIGASTRACELQYDVDAGRLTNRAVSLSDLDTNWVEDQGLAQDPIFRRSHWAPLGRQWSNLALASASSSTGVSASFFPTGSGSSGTVEWVIDNNFAFADPVLKTAAARRPYVQVDLGSLREVSKVRVWNGHKGSSSGQLDRFRVYASESALPDSPGASGSGFNSRYFQAKSDGFVAGYPATTAIFDDSGEPVMARYVRVQLEDSGSNRNLALSEIQVFGPRHKEPYEYPQGLRRLPVGCSMPNCSETAFEVQVYDKKLGNTRWIRVDGELEWDGLIGAGGPPALAGAKITNGGTASTNVNWDLATDLTTANAFTTSDSYSTTTGVSISATAELFGNGVTAGLGLTDSRGLTREEVSSTFSGVGFQMGGSVSNMPTWVAPDCGYEVRPYYYNTETISDYGFLHSYRVLDYYVVNLDRAKDYGKCEFARPEIAVTGMTQTLTSGDTTPSEDDGTYFGNVVAGFNPISRTFTITNTGQYTDLEFPATAVGVPTNSPFIVTQPELTDNKLAPGQSVTFTLTLDRASISDETDWTVTLYSNDPLNLQFEFTVFGTADGPDVDTDGDGLTNGEEIDLGIDPTKADTDGDNAPDGDEVAGGSDPMDELSVPVPWVARFDMQPSGSVLETGFLPLEPPPQPSAEEHVGHYGPIEVTVTNPFASFLSQASNFGEPPLAQQYPDLLRDFVLLTGPGSEIQIEIKGLKQGQFLVLSHHLDWLYWDEVHPFDIVVDDAMGVGRVVHDDIDYVEMEYYIPSSYTVYSNGTDPVFIRVREQGGVNDIVFNGIEILEIPDKDLDQVQDDQDNCPDDPNTGQENLDGDFEGDACDTDDDNDGLTDGEETFFYNTDPENAHSDGDNIPDGVEVFDGSDPNITSSVPAIFRARFDAEQFRQPSTLTQQGFVRLGSSSEIDAGEECTVVIPGATSGMTGSYGPLTAVVNSGAAICNAGEVISVEDQFYNLALTDVVIAGSDIGLPGSQQIEVRLDGLPAGDYEVTSFHFGDTGTDASRRFDLTVTDAIGVSRLVVANALQGSANNYGGETYIVHSNGVDSVYIYVTAAGGSTTILLSGLIVEQLLLLPSGDQDNDQVLNGVDNCPYDVNPDQDNFDGDTLGDACDPDDDNDGLTDTEETDVYGTNPRDADSDNDGVSDGDEVAAGTDPLFNPNPANGDVNGDGLVNLADVNLAQQILLQLYTPTSQEQVRWDISPEVDGVATPDGKNDMGDYLLLVRRVLGGS